MRDGAAGGGELGAPARPGCPGPGSEPGRAAFPSRRPATSLCAPTRETPRAPRLAAPRPQSGLVARAAHPAPGRANRRFLWWSESGGGRGGRWRRAGAARARPGAEYGGAGTPQRAPARLDALMESPWDLELELRRHIETCACTCDHMGYGNYMDYQVAPAAHACMCRAITSPHAHVRARPPHVSPATPRARRPVR